MPWATPRAETARRRRYELPTERRDRSRRRESSAPGRTSRGPSADRSSGQWGRRADRRLRAAARGRRDAVRGRRTARRPRRHPRRRRRRRRPAQHRHRLHRPQPAHLPAAAAAVQRAGRRDPAVGHEHVDLAAPSAASSTPAAAACRACCPTCAPSRRGATCGCCGEVVRFYRRAHDVLAGDGRRADRARVPGQARLLAATSRRTSSRR